MSPISLLLLLLPLLANPNPTPDDPYSILTYHDYSPPSPPPPPPLNPPAISCADDLGGAGSLDTLCSVSASLTLPSSVSISGAGTLSLLPHTSLSCLAPACALLFNLSSLRLANHSSIAASTIQILSANLSLAADSSLNTTARGGDPPYQTSGTPSGTNGDGGGHGGRGASCVVKEGQSPDDSWGGDGYAWADIKAPRSYGSRGGTTSREVDYGGGGGGQVWIEVDDELEVDGVISADGGHSGLLGGGGSGGSIYIKVHRMMGSGSISASGGNGLAGGGGGRVCVDVFSRHDYPQIFVHGKLNDYLDDIREMRKRAKEKCMQ